MASTCKCEFCDSVISTEDRTCPNCGAANSQYVIDKERIVTDPQTIEELQEYCAERGMPLVRMRFFIGVDYKEPKAFGIFRDTNGNVIVYKNKADGTRAIRYKGPDERFGVSEIYGKLLDECHNRGIYPDGKSNTPVMNRSNPGVNRGSAKKRSIFANPIFWILSVMALILIVFFINLAKHPNGYYKYKNTLYYLNGSSWFYYDDYSNDWYGVSNLVTNEIYEGGKDYYQGDNWDSEWGMSYFDSDAYRIYEESRHSDTDDNSDSSSSAFDNWDSGSTDWDSDW